MSGQHGTTARDRELVRGWAREELARGGNLRTERDTHARIIARAVVNGNTPGAVFVYGFDLCDRMVKLWHNGTAGVPIG